MLDDVQEPPWVVLRTSRDAVGDGGGELTEMVTESLSLPPVPVHVIEYVVLLPGETLSVPEVLPPVLKPEPLPLQLEAFDEDQRSVVLSPCVIEVSSAVRFTLGDGTLTVTRAVSLSFPPGPEQVTVYVLVELGETPSVPEVLPPVLKPEPLPEHEVALELLHESVELPPLLMVLGDALRDTEGDGVLTVTRAESLSLPPEPVQVTE